VILLGNVNYKGAERIIFKRTIPEIKVSPERSVLLLRWSYKCIHLILCISPLCLKLYTPPALIQQTLHTQPGVSYAQITSKSLPPTPTLAPAPPVNHPLQQFNDISDLKALMKSLFEQTGTMINLLTTVLTKLK
jgi:hypothetical protein